MVAELNFSSPAEKLPPQNIEAEEAILGGILIDPSAISRIADILHPEALSLDTHKIIYRAAQTLYAQGKSTDLMSVTMWLRDHNRLEKIGGMNKLAQLVDRTVSAVNIDQYASLVMEKYTRRLLISFGHQVVHHGYEAVGNLSSLMDWAKRKLDEIYFASPAEQEDLDTHKYNKCMAEVAEIQLGTPDPGLKFWKMEKLANKYGYTAKRLEEMYFRHLLKAENEPLMTWEELKATYGDSVRSWLQHGWLPKGSVILEHGDGGSGKTRLGYNFLYHIATGQNWDTFSVEQSRCLVVQTDESQGDMMQALEDRFGEQHLVANPFIKFKTRWTIDFIQSLEEDIKSFKPSFVLIDSLTTINKHSIFSENDVEYARPLLLLKDLAQKYGLTMLVIHHSSKEGTSRGSTAIRNSVSEVWHLKVDNSPASDGSYRLITIEKSRSRKPTTYQLRYNEEDNSYTCLGKVGESEDGVLGLLRERIVAFLNQAPGVFYQLEEIHNHIGGGSDRLRVTCNELARDGVISKKKKGKVVSYGINFGSSPDRDNPGNDPQTRSAIPITDHGDRYAIGIAIGIRNAHSESVSSDADHRSSKIEKFSNEKVAENFESRDRYGDQNAQNPYPESDSNTDHDTDHDTDRDDRYESQFSGNAHQESVTETDHNTDHAGDHDDRYCDSLQNVADSLQEEEPIKVGDWVESLYDSRQGLVAKITEQHRGSPKNPFIVYFATVSWSDGLRSDEHLEYLKRIEAPATASESAAERLGHEVAIAAPPEIAPDHERSLEVQDPPLPEIQEPATEEVSAKTERPKTKGFKVGDRVIHKEGTTAATVVEVEPKLMIRYDHTDKDACQFPSNMRFLEPHEDPKIIAKNLFETLKGNARIKSKPHKLHKKDNPGGRVGNVYETFERGGCYWVRMMHSSGFIDYCLEAIEVLE